ncbi:MAG TPA: glycosyltransferase family 4 protein, partial [Candidatus Synoicihabitans sp.]|nr:glycosyltransferase family 4 protein [Candidatus Synoicihabitans sp.]
NEEETRLVERTVPGARARTLPLFLHPTRASSAAPTDEPTTGLLFVGGYEHTPNRDAIDWMVREIFPLVRQKLPQVELHLCGSGHPASAQQAAPPGVLYHVNLSDEALQEHYRSARVCVVPLRYGAGLKGKVVEALFHQKPLVTTTVGAQGLPELAAFSALADDAPSFADAIVRFYCDDTARTAAQSAAGAYVRSRFSTEAALAVLERDLTFRRASDRVDGVSRGEIRANQAERQVGTIRET